MPVFKSSALSCLATRVRYSSDTSSDAENVFQRFRIPRSADQDLDTTCSEKKVRNPLDTSSDADEVSQRFRTSRSEGRSLDSCLADRVRNPSDTSSDAEKVSQGFRTPRAEDQMQVTKRYSKGTFRTPRMPPSDVEEVSQGFNLLQPPSDLRYPKISTSGGEEKSNPWDTSPASEKVSEGFGNFEPFGYLLATCI